MWLDTSSTQCMDCKKPITLSSLPSPVTAAPAKCINTPFLPFTAAVDTGPGLYCGASS